jgi:hypothetical protein
MDGITEMACFLRKNRDLSIENSLGQIECTLAPSWPFWDAFDEIPTEYWAV